MKLLIESQAPDGIRITIQEPIIALTWQSMYDFICMENELELAIDKMNDDQRKRFYNLFDEIIGGKKV